MKSKMKQIIESWTQMERSFVGFPELPPAKGSHRSLLPPLGTKCQGACLLLRLRAVKGNVLFLRPQALRGQAEGWPETSNLLLPSLSPSSPWSPRNKEMAGRGQWGRDAEGRTEGVCLGQEGGRGPPGGRKSLLLASALP